MTEQEFWDEVYLVVIERSSPGYARYTADAAIKARRDAGNRRQFPTGPDVPLKDPTDAYGEVL